jgi:hypothetical protein
LHAFYLGNFRLIRNIVNARVQDWKLAQEVTDEAMLIAYRKRDELFTAPGFARGHFSLVRVHSAAGRLLCK